MNAPSPDSSPDSPASETPDHGADQRDVAPHGHSNVHLLVDEIGGLLAKSGETLAVGETSAGGALASLIHCKPTNETWFRGGIVPYAGSDVPFVQGIHDVASAHGVVSEEYAAALAGLVQRTFACDWALAESGIAGPQTGRRSAKPVGMVCFAVVGPDGVRATAGERGAIPRAAGEPSDPGILALGQRKRPNVAVTVHSGLHSNWTSTHRYTNAGRAANQRQFAVASLRFLRDVLAAHHGEQ